ncbi:MULTISPECIES: spore protease YyaC [Sutcliffiella]|uniref:Spore protease YyaC n=1 Tax=Sutcliffiella cohnii TaxID=33932 RepID=A0A223KWU5_9BACI|nr:MULTISPECIES: spore protease YyaC [Sutcliffiella]AST93922.1 spore protease YyaC [Sutcliffiella cohnii]MED4015732.1 spore protease YyaC [Sutcliffiella cohnii]WBL15127.1 spore protease YyaC [Sutcliffiella sp. NC1]
MNLKSNFFDKKSDITRIAHDAKDAPVSIAKALQDLMPRFITLRPIVIVCIGTDRSTGDSLGPLVGTKLREYNSPSIHVYGTLDDPIHAVNLEDKIDQIMKLHPNPFIIAIDACLGRLKSVGQITVSDGPVMPGAGVKKDLPPVGNIHLTGIVNVSGFMEFFVLQNTRLSLVMKMANTIAASISELSLNIERKDLLSDFDTDQEQMNS